ncbi:MAG: helix-turn-helix transcriptional regulator [Spirochaetales bacterium]|jgi:y4mF family transcriptional regulator|nr:helix-turn-helix transcriptional regulator [Spirochaetales bacterium]MBR6199198.1 helix-turn-helix transcriptional regulator [Spirochaetales bacterium]
MKIQDSISIGQIIKQRRISLGLTQEETAQMCHVGKRFLSELENGKATLQLNKVLQCIEMLGINLYAVNREDER